MTFTSDELILLLLSLVRLTHPTMLRQDTDGFTVDFETIERSAQKGDDELLLLKMRPVLEMANEGQGLVLDLSRAESQRLAYSLGRLEVIQTWPAAVLAMSQALRHRLMPGNDR